MSNEMDGRALYVQYSKGINKSNSIVDIMYENWELASKENQAFKTENTELKKQLAEFKEKANKKPTESRD